MSTIQPINNTNAKASRPTIITASNTGFVALTSMGLATASAVTKNKSIKKHHKKFAYLTGILTLIHLGTVLHSRLQFKKQ